MFTNVKNTSTGICIGWLGKQNSVIIGIINNVDLMSLKKNVEIVDFLLGKLDAGFKELGEK